MKNTIDFFKVIIIYINSSFSKLLDIITNLIYFSTDLILKAFHFLFLLLTQFLQYIISKASLILQWVTNQFTSTYFSTINFLNWGIESNGPIFIIEIIIAFFIIIIGLFSLMLQIERIKLKKEELKHQKEQIEKENISKRNQNIKDAGLLVLKIILKLIPSE